MKPESRLTAQINELMQDEDKSRAEKIKAIEEIYEYARAEQRTASESMMVDDDGLNEALRHAEKALQELNAESPAKKDSHSAATL
ncbi:hypothetical protein [Rhizobium sp. L1K21]|uniref:hypothetical protein n=1 Tax=Rhizobium sp. L1K21 TaxID=2954933 RepID=UPI002091F659|nr:hypothetical protein [Rhizobium sp. L1K21]MCO6184675.1 hypothetical protein [Rhizobium sp. L1K21]